MVYCSSSCSIISHFSGERLSNWGPCRRLRSLCREGSLSCHSCCDTGPRFYRSHLKGPSHLVSSYNKPRSLMTYRNPVPNGKVQSSRNLKVNYVMTVRLSSYIWIFKNWANGYDWIGFRWCHQASSLSYCLLKSKYSRRYQVTVNTWCYEHFVPFQFPER